MVIPLSEGSLTMEFELCFRLFLHFLFRYLMQSMAQQFEVIYLLQVLLSVLKGVG
jgi:hypothetical protein